MPFTLIKGRFRVVGFSPDGDTLRFQPDDRRHFRKLSGRAAVFRKNPPRSTSLRFEAIDTLETHFLPKGSTAPRGEKIISQPRDLADSATDFTLKAAGFKNVEWGTNMQGERSKILSAANDGTRGYILSRAVERFGRPVAFVFAGNTNKADGSSQFLDVALLRKSINFKIAAAGLAYPAYYEDMCRFIDLRDAITRAVERAYNADRGVWARDKSRGLTVNGLKQLRERDVIFPKLFRRLAEYLAGVNNDKVTGFKAWLKSRREEIMVLSTGLMGTLDQVVFQKGKRVGLTTEPEDIIFKP